MAIQGLEQQSIFGKQKNIVFRTDIIKFGTDIQLVQAAGPPSGNWPDNSLFLNIKDLNLYISANFKTTQTPSVIWYKLNGDAKDFSSNGFDGTTAGSPVFSAGKYGDGITFDGSDDKLTIPGTTGINFNSDWTWEGWVFIPATVTSGNKLYLLDRFVGAAQHITMWIDITAGPNAKVKVQWNNGGGATTVTINTSLTLGVWTYLSINHDNSANQIYLVETEKASDNVEPVGATIVAPADGGEDILIGYSPTNTDFGGDEWRLDDFKLWNKLRYLNTGVGIADTGGNFTKLDSFNIDANHWIVYEPEDTNLGVAE